MSVYWRAALTLVTNRGGGSSLPSRVVSRSGVTVDASRLAAYSRVCGFRLRDTLPATYPHVLAFPLAMELMSGSDFPFPVVGLVHIANRITVLRPVLASSTLDFSVSAEKLRPHDRGRQLDVVTVALCDGEEVWRGVATYLRREDSSSSSSSRRDSTSPPQPTAIWRVGSDVGRQYAAVSGDRNPIHTSRLGARLFGFARPIAHGMWTKARCLAALDGRLPDEYTVDVAFKSPILLPATVGFHAAPGDAWTLSVHEVKSGRPHLTGTISP